jgi:hypothetical protein
MSKKTTSKSEDKELLIQSKRKHIDNAKQEVVMIGKQKLEVTPKVELLRNFVAVRKKMHLKAMENYSYVRPTYAFQQDPEYVKLQQEMSGLEFELELIQKESQLAGMEQNLKNMDEQLASLEKTITDTELLIKELEEN